MNGVKTVRRRTQTVLPADRYLYLCVPTLHPCDEVQRIPRKFSVYFQSLPSCLEAANCTLKVIPWIDFRTHPPQHPVDNPALYREQAVFVLSILLVGAKQHWQ